MPALATQPTGVHFAQPSNEAAVDTRVAALPLPAQEKFERLRRTEQRARAFIDGLFDARQSIRERRDDAIRALGHFDRAHKPEAAFTFEEDEKTGKRRQVPTVFPDREKLVKQIAFANGELQRLAAEQQAAAVGFSTENILDFLASRPSTKFIAVPVKPVKGETIATVRAAQDALRTELAAIESAPRTTQEAKAAMRAEVAALAEKGKPDISGLFHGGAIIWPTQLLVADGSGVHPHIVSATINDAHALAIWANAEQIVRALDAAIEAEGNGASALTREEQAARIAECEANLIQLQRREERLIELAEDAGQQVRRSCTNPLILLGIEQAKS